MKRSLAFFMTAVMTLSLSAALVSCGNDASTTTTANQTTAGKITTAGPTGSTDPTTPSSSGDYTFGPVIEVDDVTLVSANQEFQYRMFECKYDSSGPNGTYTTNDLADFMSQYGWTMGDKEMPAEAIEAVKAFDQKADGPFGDCNVGFYENNPSVPWNEKEGKDNHGLICRTTFTIEDKEALMQSNPELIIEGWFDNTPSVYINGKLVLYCNTECSGDPTRDWHDGFVDVREMTDMEGFIQIGEDETFWDYVQDGENEVVIVMLDGWGGRECAIEITAYTSY